MTHQSLIHSAPTGTDTGADTIGERIGTAHQPGADTQEFLGGRAGGAEARCDHAAGYRRIESLKMKILFLTRIRVII